MNFYGGLEQPFSVYVEMWLKLQNVDSANVRKHRDVELGWSVFAEKFSKDELDEKKLPQFAKHLGVDYLIWGDLKADKKQVTVQLKAISPSGMVIETKPVSASQANVCVMAPPFERPVR